MIRDRLLTLGYKPVKSRPSDKLVKATNIVMKELQKKQNAWLLLVSDNAGFLRDLSNIVPQTYALTERKAVHSIDPGLMLDVARLQDYEDESHLLPLGRHALENPGLLWFNDPDQATDYIKKFRGSVAHLFREWTEPWIKVVMAVVSTNQWNKTLHQRLVDKVENLYGSYAGALVSERLNRPIVFSVPQEVEFGIKRAKLID